LREGVVDHGYGLSETAIDHLVQNKKSCTKQD
jgi:hypothetical protein